MKTYQIQLTVQGPVFIGDNRILRKTEYILNKKEHKAFIPNPKSLIKYLKKVNRLNEFKKYISNNPRSLENFFKMNGLFEIEKNVDGETIVYNESTKHENIGTLNDIHRFVRNGNSEVYVPGSSVKGAFKTILVNHPRMLMYKESGTGKEKNVDLLFRYLSFSDSEIISPSNLEIYQKIDLGKKENYLSVYRECLKPGTIIKLNMTVYDEFPLNIEQIKEAIQLNMQNYELKWFNEMLKLDAAKKLANSHQTIKNQCDIQFYLGGGVGVIDKYTNKSIDTKIQLKNNVYHLLSKNAPLYKKYKRINFIPENVPLVAKGTYSEKARSFLEFGICGIKFIEIGSVY